MKLIDAIKNEKGNPFEIPDSTRNDLPKLFKELGFKKGVEIGVHQGNNIVNYCKEGLEIYGIDPWVPYTEHFLDSRRDTATNRTIRALYRRARRQTEAYPNCKLIEKTSIEALEDFEDNSLDFIYIDGDHRFDHIAIDLIRWSYKIKKGGVIAGHDYLDVGGYRGTLHVGPVVDAFVEATDIDNWYIIGRKDGSMSFVIFKNW